MKRLRNIVSFLLLGALAYIVSPKELAHELFHQHETEDVKCTDECAHHISNHHQHCDLFELSTPPLYHHVESFCFIPSDCRVSFLVNRVQGYRYSADLLLFFRGPPVEC